MKYRSTLMYSGGFMVLLGEGIRLGSIAVLIFAPLLPVAPIFYVPLKEERDLEKRLGQEFLVYKANVPRWTPRPKPWNGKVS